MILDAVILDMDGLMLDTEGLYKRAWQAAAMKLGFALEDDFYFTLIGRSNADSETALVERFGANFPLDAFRQRWPELWSAEVTADGIPRKPGLAELLEHLKEREIPIAVATSSDRSYAARSLQAGNLDARCFAHIVTGEQVENGKPAPDIYIEAARRLAADPARCLAVEDSDAGIASATGAGMLGVMVPDLKPPSPEARAVAYRVFSSMHDVVTLMRG